MFSAGMLAILEEFADGAAVGIEDPGYEVAVTHTTWVLVASTVTVVVAVMGSRLSHRLAKKFEGDRRCDLRCIAGGADGCAVEARGAIPKATSVKAERRLCACIVAVAGALRARLLRSPIIKLIRLVLTKVTREVCR